MIKVIIEALFKYYLEQKLKDKFETHSIIADKLNAVLTTKQKIKFCVTKRLKVLENSVIVEGVEANKYAGKKTIERLLETKITKKDLNKVISVFN